MVIYLDDILIYLDNISEHKKHIKEVLHCLCANNLYASPNKCVFHRQQIEFLGYVLGPQGVQMDKSKVQVIQDWLTPRHLRDIQAFLGFANFYRCFIHNYSKITVPLTCLTRKSCPWNWSSNCESAFQLLKSSFITTLVLAYWDLDSPLVLKTDVSDLALAMILSTYVEGELHPIAYYSRALNTTELNYDIHDKELLAIVKAFKKWRHYLEGTPAPTDVIIDHKNLTYFCKSKNLSHHQAHWSEYLSQFNLQIHFCPGALSSKPDTLTHQWDVYSKGADTSSSNSNWHPIFLNQQVSTKTRAGRL